VEAPAVPDVRDVDGRSRVLNVLLVLEVIAEDSVGDVSEGVDPPRSLVVVVLAVFPRQWFEHLPEDPPEVAAKLLLARWVLVARHAVWTEHASCEAIELERIETGLQHRQGQRPDEEARPRGRDGVERLSALDEVALAIDLQAPGVAKRAGRPDDLHRL